MTLPGPEDGRDGLRLTYLWHDEVEPFGELAAAVRFEGFAGSSSGYFHSAELLGFASELRRYPFGDAVARLAGGYPSPGEEHLVSVTARARGRRGQLGVRVHLVTADPAPSDAQWCRKEATVEVLTTYESLRRFASELEHLARGSADEAWLAAELLA